MYPCTAFKSRYSGAYEGGDWVAFALHPEDIPEDATSDDITASDFWGLDGESDETRFVGRGATPDEAYADLLRRLKGDE